MEVVVTLSEEETERRVSALEKRLEEEGREGTNNSEEAQDAEVVTQNVMELYRQLPLPSIEYSDFQLQPGYKEVVVVVGGETEVSSKARL